MQRVARKFVRKTRRFQTASTSIHKKEKSVVWIAALLRQTALSLIVACNTIACSSHLWQRQLAIFNGRLEMFVCICSQRSRVLIRVKCRLALVADWTCKRCLVVVAIKWFVCCGNNRALSAGIFAALKYARKLRLQFQAT